MLSALHKVLYIYLLKRTCCQILWHDTSIIKQKQRFYQIIRNTSGSFLVIVSERDILLNRLVLHILFII